MNRSYRSTLYSCYLGYVTQAIVNNLAPLLFIIFQTRYAISFEMIGRLVLVNFVTQIVVDFLAVRFVDRLGYRRPMVFAHLCCALGLVLLSVLPMLLPGAPYAGLVMAVIIYAIGGGLLEVMVSPIVDALPSDDKAAAMSLLHSFYCWGQMVVVLLSTLALHFLGQDIWWLLPILWALVPLYNLFRFCRVPLTDTVPEEKRTGLRGLFSSRVFILALIIMTCAGASELTMSQWSSLFAELGLGVPKMWGDLMGPCLFALLMALGRMGYGLWGQRLDVSKALAGCAALCILCYLTTVLSPNPVLSLLGCALCGFSVSLMWPGATSLTAARFPLGGTAMFAMLALFGDLGCSLGPWLTGIISDAISHAPQAAAWAESLGMGLDQLGLKAGLAIGAIFPLVLLLCLVGMRRGKQAAR